MEKDSKKIMSETVSSEKARKAANISYRQISEWDRRGMLPHQKREDEKDWRKFTGTDVIVLSIISKLKERGIPITRLKNLFDWLKTEKFLNFLFRYIFQFKSKMYLVTDLEDFWVLPDEDVEIHVLAFSEKPMIVLFLNPIVETTCEILGIKYPKIEEAKNKEKNLFKQIKSRVKTNPYQNIKLLVRGGEVVEIRSETSELQSK
jgi:DNA-binding transcriptional MerR regulator